MGNTAVECGFHRNDKRIYRPGMAWYCDWIYDPLGKSEQVMIKTRDSPTAEYLSVFYWRDWAETRAPITIVLPSGEWWEIDRKSSNGKGWQVVGDIPTLSCAPSILTPLYHGDLTGGKFSPDIEGRTYKFDTKVT